MFESGGTIDSASLVQALKKADRRARASVIDNRALIQALKNAAPPPMYVTGINRELGVITISGRRPSILARAWRFILYSVSSWASRLTPKKQSEQEQL